MFLADEIHFGKRPDVRVEVAQLCEFFRANLKAPISLTEMGRRSGLSARVLQYSFQKAFGLRPKEWLRKQRLHAARAILLKPMQIISITARAYEFCFASPSDFAHRYKLEFGETPSDTIKRTPHKFDALV